MKVPSIALAPAFSPAVLATQGTDLAGRPVLNVQSFTGAVTLLDFFAAQVPFVLDGLDFEAIEAITDDELDRAMRVSWRIAASMLRTRPQPPPEEPPARLALVNGSGGGS